MHENQFTKNTSVRDENIDLKCEHLKTFLLREGFHHLLLATSRSLRYLTNFHTIFFGFPAYLFSCFHTDNCTATANDVCARGAQKRAPWPPSFGLALLLERRECYLKLRSISDATEARVSIYRRTVHRKGA